MLVRLSHAAVLLLAPVALLPLSYGFTTPGALGARNARPVLSCDVRDLRAAAPAVWQGAARLQTRMSADAGPGWADDDSSVKWEEPPLETAARTATAEEIKRQFLVAAAGANRGLAAAGDQRRELLELVGELEALQADGAAPNDDPALLGEWRLLFTSAFDVLSLGAIPLVSVGQIFQNVYDREGAGLLTVENVVELSPAADPILRAVAGGSTLQLVRPPARPPARPSHLPCSACGRVTGRGSLQVVTAQGVKQGADQIGIRSPRPILCARGRP